MRVLYVYVQLPLCIRQLSSHSKVRQMLLFTPAENEMEGKSPLSWDVSCQIPAEERGHLCYMEWKQLLPKKKKILDGEGNERSED